MQVFFKKDYLLDLYEVGKTKDKKHRFQPEIVRKYRRCIDILKDASRIESLYAINALNYEKLKGDKSGFSSIRVNDQYRIEFEEEVIENQIITTICNIIELSNHYK
jgi:proteic killer suppression protein